jgi:demethylmenaquinone methyltransferase/2-methoxy-6-polyprenyl-1,4-benzoquinol methylase
VGRTVSPLSSHPALGTYYGAKGRRSFVRRIFDDTARDYDRVERMMALGSGSWYRRQALLRAGLTQGMRVLDVATGTGLVAREQIAITGDPKLVLGLDPSMGMIAAGRAGPESLIVPTVLAVAERIPLPDATFDFLSMGYGLRHLSDLLRVFREFHRVVKPGGIVCILEITRPASGLRRALLKSYMRFIVPLLARFTARARPIHADTRLLWRYYWDTIEACVPVDTVLAALRDAGFTDVLHRQELSLFSEYTAKKPAA